MSKLLATTALGLALLMQPAAAAESQTLCGQPVTIYPDSTVILGAWQRPNKPSLCGAAVLASKPGGEVQGLYLSEGKNYSILLSGTLNEAGYQVHDWEGSIFFFGKNGSATFVGGSGTLNGSFTWIKGPGSSIKPQPPRAEAVPDKEPDRLYDGRRKASRDAPATPSPGTNEPWYLLISTERGCRLASEEAKAAHAPALRTPALAWQDVQRSGAAISIETLPAGAEKPLGAFITLTTDFKTGKQAVMLYLRGKELCEGAINIANDMLAEKKSPKGLD